MGGVQGHGEGGFPGHQPGARRGEMHPHDMVKSPTWKSLGQAPESTKFAKDEDTDCPFFLPHRTTFQGRRSKRPHKWWREVTAAVTGATAAWEWRRPRKWGGQCGPSPSMERRALPPTSLPLPHTPLSRLPAPVRPAPSAQAEGPASARPQRSCRPPPLMPPPVSLQEPAGCS